MILHTLKEPWLINITLQIIFNRVYQKLKIKIYLCINVARISVGGKGHSAKIYLTKTFEKF